MAFITKSLPLDDSCVLKVMYAANLVFYGKNYNIGNWYKVTTNWSKL